MQPLIVSYSGIRGIAGESLTEEVAARYGHAFGQLIRRRHDDPVILLGRDTRPSGPGLVRGAIAGLRPHGRIIDLGVTATPTLQHALGALGAHAALCITASHNPTQWNGLKLFLGPENTVLDGAQMKELRRLAEAATAPAAASWKSAGPPLEDRHPEALDLHVARVCAQVDVDRIRARGFRVAVDSGGGAGEEVTLRLLAALGCAVVPVHARRESEPIPEHLGDLRQAVVAKRCALGIAQDLDADRLALITEDGVAPGEELTLVLAVDHLLARGGAGARVVVKNVATTRAVDDVASRHGAALVETPVGEVNLSRALAREIEEGRVAFGGEGNGGVILPAVSLGRDSLVGTALILERLASDPSPLSGHLARLPRYHGRKERMPLPQGAALDLDVLFERLEGAFPEGETHRIDGLRIRFEDGTWVGLRPSNTEPILRIVAESPNPDRLDPLLTRTRALVEGSR